MWESVLSPGLRTVEIFRQEESVADSLGGDQEGV